MLGKNEKIEVKSGSIIITDVKVKTPRQVYRDEVRKTNKVKKRI